ncbi:MAG: zinc ABC transporter substrate-binding protein [Campylobacterales bacterium]|nr:zinc ABC transporter substrate-binding protein [Campylobacterales bacterium]
MKIVQKICLAIFANTMLSADLNVVVSIIPQKSFVEEIGKEHVKVISMTQAGSNPHTYEPKPSQMKELTHANIYFSIGVEFEEAWLDKFASQNKKLKIVDSSKGVEKIEMIEHHHEKHHEHNHHEHEGKDPHIWLSPSIIKIISKNIYDTLVENDPQNMGDYEKNYNLFLKKLEDTDVKIKQTFSKLPKNSKFMVFHPSWGYFAKEYNLIQVPIEVEGKNPKPQQLQNIIKEAKKENIKAIITQPEFSQKSAQTIANELKINVVSISPLPSNWSETLLEMAKTIADEK